MPSSIFVLPTTISFLLALNLCSAYEPGSSGPAAPSSGPTVPSGPRPPGWDCAFNPVVICGPDTTSPAYNACLVGDNSVSEFIQCAGQQSTIAGNDNDNKPISALDVLVSATKIPACGRCNLGTTFPDFYSRKDKSVKLSNYLCGKVNDSDICCLSRCIGAKQPEHSLKGICKVNDVSLWENAEICGSGSSGGGGGGGGGGSGDTGQAAASSSTIVAGASKPTPTPSTSSSIKAQTTLPTQTASSSPAGSSSSSAALSIRAADIIALGFLVVILTAGITVAI